MNQPVLKTDILFEQLQKELGNYTPGEKFITSREIMKRYNVSQLVVDQTMGRFRSAGLLQVVPGRGTFVTAGVERFHADAPPTILFAVPRWNSPDLAIIEEHLHRMQKEMPDFRLLFHSYDYSERVPDYLPLEEENVKGVAMLTSSDCWNAETLRKLEAYAARVPLVVMGRHNGDMPILTVGGDDILAGNMAADYLYECGHRKIAVLLSEPHNGVILERIRGVTNYAMLRGMECEVLDCGVRSGEYAPDKTYRYFRKRLEEGMAFTAVIGISLDSFTGAVNACLNAGVRVPEDLSLIAIGSPQTAEIQHPPLDCIDTTLEKQMDAILEILKNPGAFTPENNPYGHFRPRVVKNGSVRIMKMKGKES